jgi:hypothetical protein
VTFTFPEDLAPEVFPLAWVVGSWSGRGFIEYPDIPRTEFRADTVFDHDGGPYLIYRSTLTVIGPDGEDAAVWSSEQGYWRVPPEAPDGFELTENQHAVELVVADASGSIALYLGVVGNGKIEIATDLMARTASAPDIGGSSRLYGNVAGELLFSFDIAAFGNPLQSYASGRLTRVEES